MNISCIKPVRCRRCYRLAWLSVKEEGLYSVLRLPRTRMLILNNGAIVVILSCSFVVLFFFCFFFFFWNRLMKGTLLHLQFMDWKFLVPIWNTFSSWQSMLQGLLCDPLVIDSIANYLKLSGSQTIWGCYGQQRASNGINSTWSPAMATVTS